MLALRIDKSFPAVKAWLGTHSFGGFGVREVAGESNEHWHFLLEIPANGKKIQAYRVSLTRDVPELKGNAGYSLTEVRDVEKYERYMCKGDTEEHMPEVVWSNSLKYDQARIQELHDSYWECNRQLQPRKRQLSVIDEVTQACKEAKIEWSERTAISREYIKSAVARKKGINIFQVKASVNVIQCLLCPDDKAIELLAEQI